jgi:hypothetical protein
LGGEGKTVKADETYLTKSPKTRKPADLPLHAKPAPNEAMRADNLLRGVVGKRLTYETTNI